MTTVHARQHRAGGERLVGPQTGTGARDGGRHLAGQVAVVHLGDSKQGADGQAAREQKVSPSGN